MTGAAMPMSVRFPGGMADAVRGRSTVVSAGFSLGRSLATAGAGIPMSVLLRGAALALMPSGRVLAVSRDMPARGMLELAGRGGALETFGGAFDAVGGVLAAFGGALAAFGGALDEGRGGPLAGRGGSLGGFDEAVGAGAFGCSLAFGSAPGTSSHESSTSLSSLIGTAILTPRVGPQCKRNRLKYC